MLIFYLIKNEGNLYSSNNFCDHYFEWLFEFKCIYFIKSKGINYIFLVFSP